MSDDYGLLNQAAEQNHSSEIPDAFYDNFGRLPEALKSKLSLHDLRCIYEFMVSPVVWVVAVNMASGGTRAALPQRDSLVEELVYAASIGALTIHPSHTDEQGGVLARLHALAKVKEGV